MELRGCASEVIWPLGVLLTLGSLALCATLLQASTLFNINFKYGMELSLIRVGWSIDIHSSTLGLGKSDNSLARIPEIRGELAMVNRLSCLTVLGGG